MIKVLNPFSPSLKKDPLMYVGDSPIYVDGDFKAYQNFTNSVVHTFKNIVIAERVKLNKELISNVKNDIKPKGEANLYFDYERPKWAMQEGLRIAKEINFTVN